MGDEEWIPRLEHLVQYRLVQLERHDMGRISAQVWKVPERFVPRWIALHLENRAVAQDHWEQAVQVALRSARVVGPTSGAAATRRAVTAALTLLESPYVHGTCWIGLATDHDTVAAVRQEGTS
jgi:hypothetical protein